LGGVAWCVDAHDRRQGIGQRYYPNGNLSWEATFKDDQRNGLMTSYDNNGLVIEQTTYLAGVQQETIRWRDGRPWNLTTYRDGAPNGLARWWHENGKVSSEGELRRGRLDGVWLYYDERGVLLRVQRWKDGKAVPQQEVRAELERALDAEKEPATRKQPN